MAKKNNNKTYGLNKERQVKKLIEEDEDTLFVTRARGSFGAFDIQAYKTNHLLLVSVKSTRQRYWSKTPEIRKIQKTRVPMYCKKQLWVWWSPRKDREKKGWEKIDIR